MTTRDAFGRVLHSFGTSLAWDDDGDTREAEVRVTYDRHAGFAGDRIDPPEPASVEIYAIERISGDDGICVGSFFEDADLIAECFQHWADDEIAAAEYRAEQRADDRMMDRLDTARNVNLEEVG